MMRNYLPVLFILFSTFVHAAELQVIPLNYRSAVEVIPLVIPMIDESAVITGSGYKLIVRATPQQINDIKIILKEIDRPLQQLIISVRQNQHVTGEKDRQGIAGNIGSDKSRVQFGNPARRGNLTVQYQNNDDVIQGHTGQRDTMLDDHISQQVRTISGRPAFIAIGQSIPIPQQQTIIRGHQIIRTQTTDYHDSNTGFYVTPRVHGDQVTLQISTQREQPIGYQVESSRIATSVRGKLGEWIALGSSNENASKSASTMFQNRQSTNNKLRNVSVRVTLAHQEK